MFLASVRALGASGWGTRGLPSERNRRYGARSHRLGVRPELRKRLDEVLTIGFADPRHHVYRGCVHLREHEVDELPRLVRDIDEKLSSVVRMRFAAHESAAFQRVEE